MESSRRELRGFLLGQGLVLIIDEMCFFTCQLFESLGTIHRTAIRKKNGDHIPKTLGTAFPCKHVDALYLVASHVVRKARVAKIVFVCLFLSLIVISVSMAGVADQWLRPAMDPYTRALSRLCRIQTGWSSTLHLNCAADRAAKMLAAWPRTRQKSASWKSWMWASRGLHCRW